ncbi:Tetraspanin/Peripherin [Corchorus olitorius]|uniref:Tetraspanin/Peripherin n=1 Tax=Corchorus olitorius TaxID=93759 RepID=A0A1R3K0Y7_9ROSI|nr:Tetraspanin/Peripherin [Corchorus olitorius]
MTKPKNVGIIFNSLMIALSIPILVVGIMIENKADRRCGSPNTDTGMALIFAAGMLISVAIVGLLLNICELTFKCCCGFWLYVIFMVFCIVIGLVTTIFILKETSKGSGIKLAGKGYEEFKLGSYAKYLQKMVKDDWNSTKTCFIKTDVCTKFNNKYLNDTVEKFYKEPLTAIQMKSTVVKNNLPGLILNVLLIVLSLPIMVIGWWLLMNTSVLINTGPDGCGGEVVNGVGLGIICAGALLMFVSVDVRSMVLFILFNLGFTIYTLADTNQGFDPQLWNATQTCMIKSDICTKFNTNDTLEKFYKEPLTAIQSGCCKPSDDCGFTYSSPANWTAEKGVSDKNPDCNAWDNDPKVMCFNCDSCKAVFADKMNNMFKKWGFVNFGFIALLIIAFVAYLVFREDDNYTSNQTTGRRAHP